MDSALKSQLHGSEVANIAWGIFREGSVNKTEHPRNIVYLHGEFASRVLLVILVTSLEQAVIT